MIFRILKGFGFACGGSAPTASSVAAQDQFLTAPKVSSELKHRAVRGGVFTVAAQVAGLAIQVISTIVLSRLLTPRDYGLVTMVTTFTLLLGNFGINGFTEAVIQQASITQEQLSTLFWINLGANAFLTLAFIVACPWIASLYREPDLLAIGVAVSFSFLLYALGTMHLALLKRNLQFRIVNLNQIGSMAIGLTVAIVGACLGWGYWALVANLLVTPFLTGAAAWVSCNWRPSLPKRGAGVGPLIRFAMNTYGHFCTNYGSRNLDKLLVGSVWGSKLLGHYKRAYDLFFMPVGLLPAALSTVAIASLSPLRNEPERFRKYYLKTICVVAFIGMGLSAAFFVVGKELLRVLLGPKWDDAGRIFTFFAPGMGIILIYSTNAWLHLSLGKAERLFRWGALELAVTAAAAAIASRFGPSVMAATWVGAFCLLIGPGLSYAGRPIGLTFRAVVSAAWPYTLAGVLSGSIGFSAHRFAVGISPSLTMKTALLRTVLLGSLTAVLYIGSLFLFPTSKSFGPLADVWKILCPKWMQPSILKTGRSLSGQ
jgi:PST family polysaccharide transporter